MSAERTGATPMSQGLSVYLDLLRFLAAMLVFIHHASFHRFSGGLPGLWYFATLGDDAVMLFFVLSGLVIAYVSERQEHRFDLYLAARLSRLWSICVPALVLTAVADFIGMQLAPHLYAFELYGYEHAIARLAACLLFLNELWFVSLQPFSNTPYWSIGYEFWYYLLFGAAMFVRGRQRWAVLGLVAIVMGPKILLLLPVWLAGVWALKTSLPLRWSEPTALAVCMVTLVAYVGYRFIDGPAALDRLSAAWFGQAFVDTLGWSRHFLSSYVVGALFALHFVGARRWLRDRQAVPLWLAAPIRYLAGFTFALYLFHNPLLQFFGAIVSWLGAWDYQKPIVVLGPLLVVLAIGPWAEAQKRPLKRLLLKGWDRLRRRGCAS
jgi:peptidoglycan/LPS O-acetylase OafA/YrhL